MPQTFIKQGFAVFLCFFQQEQKASQWSWFIAIYRWLFRQGNEQN